MMTILALSFPELIWCGFILFVASFIRGFSGFGFTAILFVGLTLFLPVIEIVPLSIALEVIASFGQARGIYSDIRWRSLGVLLITGFIGTPIGVYLLLELPEAPLRVSVLVLIFVASIVLIFSRNRPLGLPLWSFALAGFAVGVVNGATALSGLALALFFTLTDEKVASIRATMITYLFVADIWAGGILISSGFYDDLTVNRILATLPLLGLGVWLGSKRFGTTHPKTFRIAILWLLLVLSTCGLLLWILEHALPN